MELVRIYRDGDQICAIIGEMPEEKGVGFGDGVIDALRALADDLENGIKEDGIVFDITPIDCQVLEL